MSAYSGQSSLSRDPAPGSKRKREVRRHPPVYLHWNKLSDNEYRVYDPPPDSCQWREIMRLYENDHNVPAPCNNCLRCTDSPVVLEDLPADERVENKDVRIAVERELEKLAFTLGNEVTCSILVTARPDPTERVLSPAWRKKFSEAYYRVAGGDRMGWSWDRPYGGRVTALVRQVAALPVQVDPSPATTAPSASLLSPLSSSQGTPISRTPGPTVLQDITRANTTRPDIRKTSRGAPSLYKERGRSNFYRKTLKDKENSRN
jgi:hypothetical protein